MRQVPRLLKILDTPMARYTCVAKGLTLPLCIYVLPVPECTNVYNTHLYKGIRILVYKLCTYVHAKDMGSTTVYGYSV